MSTKVIDTLILDLDNTLFDWFAVWYASFEPIYLQILRVTGRAEEEVRADIRKVHQARRTSEYSFLIEEIDSLKDMRKSGDKHGECGNSKDFYEAGTPSSAGFDNRSEPRIYTYLQAQARGC